MKSFSELALSAPLHQAIADAGYTIPTPIQAQAIPALLSGRDLLGCAQTGTGKTAAFALPILQRLHTTPTADGRRHVRALVLTPTRELAAQILDSFRTYGRHTCLRAMAVFGGVDRRSQAQRLRSGADILIATPGRLLDLMNAGEAQLRHLEAFVLDEADRMLDMGFINDVKRIIAALPPKRQSLFFSATMPKAVDALANSLLTQPVKVAVAPQATPAERIEQSVFFVDQKRKDDLLQIILAEPHLKRVLVFTRTKHRADQVARKLARLNIPSDAIHGNKAQNARTRALNGFRSGQTRVLVATDIAARGIDVDNVTHVINYELPNEPESYVHRIGRTARAGNEGTAISFCASDECDYLRSIEKTMGRSISVTRTHSCHSDEAERGHSAGKQRSAQQPRRRNARGQGASRAGASHPLRRGSAPSGRKSSGRPAASGAHQHRSA